MHSLHQYCCVAYQHENDKIKDLGMMVVFGEHLAYVQCAFLRCKVIQFRNSYIDF